MAKSIIIKPTTNSSEGPVLNQELVENMVLMRRDMLAHMIDPRRDIDKECGYPTTLIDRDYRKMASRHGIASRVISVYPEETWKRRPDIYETEEGEKTEWEKKLEALDIKRSLISYMERIDTLSGLGHYGVLLLGLKDGKQLDQPASGIDETGEPSATRPKKPMELTFLRCFDEWLADVTEWETDPSNPRFGQPKFYTLKFSDPRYLGQGQSTTTSTTIEDKVVHWSRIIHVADNRSTSETIGSPRLENVFNYLYDLVKILSGSGEMFWKGGFPGYSFEVAPENIGQVEVDKESMRKEMELFSNSLQRYMALVGVSAKSLAPQVADPRGHFDTQLDAICIAKGIPKRIFMGSEQAQLASTQDKKTWNERLAHRQNAYVTPMIVRPLIDRLMALNVLPTVEKYFVEWPEIFGPSDDEQATTAFKKTQSIAAYVSSGSEHLVPPMQYLTMVLNYSTEEAQSIIEAANKHVAEFDEVMNPEPMNVDESETNIVERGKKKS